MFCYQCEQTAQGTGCTKQGVCGKDPRTAALQDLVMYAVQGLGQYAHRARQLGVTDHGADVFTLKVVFSTLTNVNFDEARFEQYLRKLATRREALKAAYEEACADR